MNKKIVVGLLLVVVISASANDSENGFNKEKLTLDKAVSSSIKHDVWLTKSNFVEYGLTDKSISASTIPDPVLSAAILNLPTDGFEFNQEPMTQMKVGIAQLFPRGDTLALQKQRYLDLAAEQPVLRQDRKAKTELLVTKIWLSAFQAQASIALIENNRGLFEQLKDIASASYSSLIGKGRQQDIIRADLEISVLDDRLIKLRTLSDDSYSQLIEWLVDDLGSPLFNFNNMYIAENLPPILEIHEDVILALETKNMPLLAEIMKTHPLVKAKGQQIQASQSGVSIAKQQYKPQWGINASYAYRDDDQIGRSRADFFSIGLTLQMPLFSNKRQDSDVSLAVRQSEAKRTEKQLLVRELMAGVASAYAKYSRLHERKALYQKAIIPKLAQQTEAVLKAYTNDDGDFAEVSQTRIAELDAKLALLNINVELRKNRALIHYYIAHQANIRESNHEY